MASSIQSAGKATRGFAWNHLYKLVEYGLTNVYTMIIARHFGPVDSAPFVVYIALGTTISLIANFAVDSILLRYLPRITNDATTSSEDVQAIGASNLRTFVGKLMSFRMLIVCTVLSLTTFCLFVLPAIVPSMQPWLGSIYENRVYILVFVFAQGIAAFSTFALIAMLQSKRVFFSSLVSRSIMILIAMVLLLCAELSIESAISLHVVSAVINASFALWWLRKDLYLSEGVEPTIVWKQIRSMAREVIYFAKRPSTIRVFMATPVMLYGIATWGSSFLGAVLGRQPDILMLRGVYGENTDEIGLYSVASLLLLMTEYLFLLGLDGTLVSVFSRLGHNDERSSVDSRVDYSALRKARKEVAGYQNVVVLPLAGFMATFPLLVLQSIYGTKYDTAADFVRYGIITLAISFGVFGGGLHLTALLSIGKQRTTFYIRLFWGVFCLILNYFLIRSFGAFGAIIGTQMCNACACGTEAFFARKYIGSALDIISMLRIVAIVAATAIGCYYLSWSFSSMNIYVQLMLNAVIYFAAVTILYGVFKVPEAKGVWYRLRSLLVRS